MLELERRAGTGQLRGDRRRQLVAVGRVHAFEPLPRRVADDVVVVAQRLLPARRVVHRAGRDVPVPRAVVRGHGRQRVALLARPHRVRQGPLPGGCLLQRAALLAQVGQQPLLVERDREQRGPVVEPVPRARRPRLHGAVDGEQTPVAAAEGHRDHERQLVGPDRARPRQGRRRELAGGRPHADQARQGARRVVHADDLHLAVPRAPVRPEPQPETGVAADAPREPAQGARAGAVAAQEVHVDLVLVDDRALELTAARQHGAGAALGQREEHLGDGAPDRRLVLRTRERFHHVCLHAAQADDQLLERLGVRLHRRRDVGEPGQRGGAGDRPALRRRLDRLHDGVPPRLARRHARATRTAHARRTDERGAREGPQHLVAAAAARARRRRPVPTGRTRCTRRTRAGRGSTARGTRRRGRPRRACGTAAGTPRSRRRGRSARRRWTAGASRARRSRRGRTRSRPGPAGARGRRPAARAGSRSRSGPSPRSPPSSGEPAASMRAAASAPPCSWLSDDS